MPRTVCRRWEDDPVIGRFLRWWTGELAGMLPASLAGRSDAGRWLHVALGGDPVTAVLEGPRERVLLELPAAQSQRLPEALAAAAGGLDPRRVRCRITLPAREALTRDLELPLAAEENLREVLGFEMSRNTPFRSEDVHFDYQVLSRDPARQRLRVRLQVVPRDRLAPVLAAISAWDPRPTPVPGAASEAQGDERAAFAFQATGYRERPHGPLNAVLVLAAVVLAALTLWMPYAEQREYRARLEREAAAALAEAEEAVALRDRLAAEREARALITDARSGRPGMVELLEGLTRALPDDTYLFRLEVGRGQVNLHGSAKAASALIAILEATPHLQAVRFASPVTRDGASGRERFHIIAELPGTPGAASGTAAAARRGRG